MKILVTGGAGFIGKHLVKYLIKKGHAVTIFDNFSNSEKKDIVSLLDAGAKLVEGDITKLQDITNATSKQNAVIHLAAKISVEDSIKNPNITFHVNIEGTRNVLVACKENNIKKIVVASSAAVYGESEPGTKLTENSKINPISPYGESKALMEEEIKKFVSKHNISYAILRFFNIYGDGQSQEYAGVITKFIEKIAAGKNLEIFGDGMQTRDFVSVQDVVEAVYSSLINDKNGIFNIASGETVTIKKLAELMIALSGKNIEIQYINSKKGDIKNSQADISLAKKEISYSPKFDLREIKNLIKT